MTLCSFVDCLDCVCGRMLQQSGASFTYELLHSVSEMYVDLRDGMGSTSSPSSQKGLQTQVALCLFPGFPAIDLCC